MGGISSGTAKDGWDLDGWKKAEDGAGRCNLASSRGGVPAGWVGGGAVFALRTRRL